jgi:nucleoside-diphosphate-sugar epimerase
VVRRLHADGHVVVTIGRNPPQGDAPYRFADLAQPLPLGLTSGLDAVIHLAANTGRDAAVSLAAECEFAEGLARAAVDSRCRMVFASSQAAALDAPSEYGRTKAAIEARILPQGAIVVRPGLVYGGPPAGLYGMLLAAVRHSPLLPDLRPRPQVQPVHVDDLAGALVAACSIGSSAGSAFNIAGPPVDFVAFLEALARLRVNRRRLCVPLPAWALRAGLGIATRWFGPRFAPERLDSLLCLPMRDNTEDLRILGVTLRTLEAGLTRGVWGRRGLLREAVLLSRALLGTRPPRGMQRRYARALGCFGIREGIFTFAVPATLLAALDTPRARVGAEVGSLGWRLGVIARLAEAEPALADAFVMLPGRAGYARMLFGLSRAGMLELRNRMLNPLARVWTALLQ